MDAAKHNDRAAWLALGAGALLATGGATGLVIGLGLPRWLLGAFFLAFPAYFFGLRALAARGLAGWERALVARAETGARIDAAAVLPANPLVAWYYPEWRLLRRTAELFSEADPAGAAALFDAARSGAPEPIRATLAREAWSCSKKVPPGERKSAWSALVAEAATAPDPPPELLQDHAELLLESGDLDRARTAFEAALAKTERDAPRVKVICRLAVIEARAGRFGAADGWLHEAEQRIPAGDPGYQALYDRTVQAVAGAKQGKREDLVSLVLGRSKTWM